LYIKERAIYMFRYLSELVGSYKLLLSNIVVILSKFSKKVAPSEIESVLQEHPAVLAAGVVGMPNPETNNLARAFVVLRPGHTCSPEELCLFAGKKLPYCKQLHGGARIVDNLPSNRDVKMDREGLMEMALIFRDDINEPLEK
jgi:acyl-coenzyme A synthetase/AMP-(fatty) acid ligase